MIIKLICAEVRIGVSSSELIHGHAVWTSQKMTMGLFCHEVHIVTLRTFFNCTSTGNPHNNALFRKGESRNGYRSRGMCGWVFGFGLMFISIILGFKLFHSIIPFQYKQRLGSHLRNMQTPLNHPGPSTMR
jgi:hypothetical protein